MGGTDDLPLFEYWSKPHIEHNHEKKLKLLGQKSK
jgi:hypothetical protein